MNSKFSKTVSVSLASAMVITSTGFTTVRTSQDAMADEAQTSADKIKETIEDSVSFTSVGQDKEETVYVITDANGKVTKKIVSDKLNNKDGNDEIKDKSDLDDIQSVKTDADFTKNSDGTITWNAKGEDVYYQGTTNKELPVDVAIKYFLDGNEISPDDLAGKSGKVTIRFEYTNKAKVDVKAGNETVSMNVPFTMISGMVLPGDKFTNIEVSNGKVMGDGKNNIVVGYAFPGLADDLDVASVDEKSDIDIPESLEITADVKDFSLLTTLTIGSSDLLASVDVDSTKTRQELEDVIDKLVSATDDLKDGTSQLKDGTDSLKSNFKTYSNGITSLTDGIGKIDDGVKTVKDNIGQFVSGLKSASEGTDTIISGLEGDNGALSGSQALSVGAVDLNEGLKSLKGSIGNSKDASTVIGGIAALRDGSKSLYGAIGSKDDLKKKNANTVSGAVASISDGASKLLTGSKTLKDSVGSTDSKKVAKDAAKKTPTTVAGAVMALANGAKQLDKGIDSLIAKLNDSKDANGKTQPGLFSAIKQINAGVGSSDAKDIAKDATSEKPQTLTGGITAVDAGVGQLQKGLTDTVKSLKASMADNDKKIEQLTKALTYISKTGVDPATGQTATSQAIDTYKNDLAALKGANQALTTVLKGMDDAKMSDSVKELKQGTQSLKENSVKLASGVEQLANGANQLKAGVSQIKSGTSSLASGASKLNSKMPQLTKGVSNLYDGVKQLSNGSSLLKSNMSALVDGAASLYGGLDKLNSKMPELKAGVNKLSAGAKQLADGNKALAAGIKTLYKGVKNELKPGLEKLYDGSVTLESGVNKLYKGTTDAKSGSDKITDATGKLTDGIDKLADGAGKLDDGVSELKEGATDKVVDAYNNEITQALDRIEATLDAADEYKIYSDADESQDTSVKFIYRSGSID